MRIPDYLSPSSIATWIEDRDEFYLKYLCENRPQRYPQTRPMSVGSSFDAYIKADLHGKLIGNDPTYSFEALFESQVEECNRDWALEAGLHAFNSYVELGAYEALMAELVLSEEAPRFEFEVRGDVDGVTLLGKPDLAYVRNGRTIILDFKVNGFCAKNAKSPEPGYVHLFGGRGSGKAHPSAVLEDVGGIIINTQGMLKPEWSRQLTIYSWVLGEAVGADFITGIDQIVSKPMQPWPELRVAQHRCRISPMFQATLLETAKGVMRAIANDHVFEDETFEGDKKRRKALDLMAGEFNLDSAEDRLFLEMTR